MVSKDYLIGISKVLDRFNMVKTLKKRYIMTCVFLILVAVASWSQNSVPIYKNDLQFLRDSLDAITIPTPKIKPIKFEKIIEINTQEQWEELRKTLEYNLKSGIKNIEFRINAKGLIMPVHPKSLLNINDPEANIRINGNNASLIPEGIELSRDKNNYVRDGSFWVLPYDQFELDDMIVDENGTEIPLREEMNMLSSSIEPVIESGEDVWRMQIELPDLSEESCRDFYVLLTRDWTSARHRVLKIKDRWLYFYLDSDDLHSDRDPNIDMKLYGISPRYRLINNPISKGLHITKGKIFIPWHYKKIRINKGGYLLHMNGCKFNSFEITGFKFCNLSRCPIGVYNSTFITGLFVHNNSFTQLSSLAFSTVNCNNIVFSDNTITNTRGRTIGFSGENFTICRNHLNNIGWMLNTTAICAGGENLLISDNVVEDFNYSAISCGSRAPTRDSVRLTYIIERNLIKLSKQYTDRSLYNTLADGGAIYIGPSCTQGIIRHNVIQDIKGIHGNRGIFLDDGAKNLAIYGNIVINTDNYFDIDLRLCNTFEKDIPDHNTNNSLFHNIMTGGYCFQDAGENSKCFGGQNILLNISKYKKYKIELHQRINDINLDNCSLTRGKIIIPKHYEHILDGFHFDALIKKQLMFK